MGGGALIPRFRNIDTKAKNFIRGYALNLYSNEHGMDPKHFAEYGSTLQDKLDSYYGSGFSIGIMGEVLARYENRVSIDKTVADAWGTPRSTYNPVHRKRIQYGARCGGYGCCTG